MTRKITLTNVAIAVIGCFASQVSFAKTYDDIDLSGYIMLDYDKFDTSLLEDSSLASGSENNFEIRRARLSLKSDIDDNWKSKFQLGFANDEVEIKDAYLTYTGWSFAELTIGQQKESFGLEKRTSSRNTLMIERSMISEAFSPGRSLGVSLSGEVASINWQLGYYEPDPDESTSAVTGRLTWVPWQQDTNLLHVGVAFSERKYDGNEFRVNEPLEVYTADSLLEGDKINADSLSQQGVELLWLKDKLTVMAEWQQAEITSIENTTHDYDGGYVQFGYQVSGGYRKYKNAKLGASSQPGWEITGRYSLLNLKQENQDAKSYAIGVNYTVNKNIKFMADYIKAEYFEAGGEITSGDAISLRFQYSF
ncbi:porin [Pseudoalteromonas sp. MMG010]|uniref:OprO/OprP family phosphate-selective porin n=1 Tax=Pseudoalteromonas sp. MMG010 TaxID=2822685 RepID=UPI001B3A6502|nr:porin [Pseudoalteromonas sp. MMG010]MBQ4833563.1 porin [Pseudoalteromonas sp. MMG010]